MLVPSMTDEEIRKEIEKDFPILYRKSLYVAAEIKKQNMPLQKKRIIKTFDYVSQPLLSEPGLFTRPIAQMIIRVNYK